MRQLYRLHIYKLHKFKQNITTLGIKVQATSFIKAVPFGRRIRVGLRKLHPVCDTKGSALNALDATIDARTTGTRFEIERI